MPGGVWLAAREAIHTSGTSVLSSVGTTTASGIDLAPAMRDWQTPAIAPRPPRLPAATRPVWGCGAQCRLISAGHTSSSHRQPAPLPTAVSIAIAASSLVRSPAASPESVCGSTSRRLIPIHPLHDGVCRQHGDWRGAGPRAHEQDLLGTCEGGWLVWRGGALRPSRMHLGCCGRQIGRLPWRRHPVGSWGGGHGSDWGAMRQRGSR